MLVSFEGIDGSGKSTVIRRVAEMLRERGLLVTTTQEPTKSWLGDMVRQGIRTHLEPLALAFLFLSDRAKHVAEFDAKSKAGIVLSDRYTDSTSAYQAAALEGRIEEPLAFFSKLQDQLFPRPDLAILLDLPVETALTRIRGRSMKEPFEQLDFLRRVRSNYLRLAKENRMVVVDASPSADVVAEKVAPLILQRVPRAAQP